jgi:hypothetical protein
MHRATRPLASRIEKSHLNPGEADARLALRAAGQRSPRRCNAGEHFAAECAEVRIGEPFWPKNAGLPGMTDVKVIRGEKWLSDRITMAVCDEEAEAPTLDSLLKAGRGGGPS